MLCSAYSFAAFAQDATRADTVLDPIVVEVEGAAGQGQGIIAKRSRSGAKTDTPLVETPQAVSVVTREQMDAQGAETVAQALRYTPGIHSDPSGYDIRYDWLQIRGFDTYGAMWLDGLILPGDPLNYATPTVNPFALERIDVIKGPASVLYGGAVPGGLVNQVSKRPQATARNEAGLATSSHGGLEGTIDMTGPLTEDGQWLYRLVALGKNMGTQIDRERDRQFMVAPSLTWLPTDQTSLTLYGYYQKDRPQSFNPRFYPAHGTLLDGGVAPIPRDLYLGDPNADRFERDFFTLGYEFEHEFSETWKVRQNLRYGRSDQNMFLALVNPGWGAWQADGHTLNRMTRRSDDSLTSFNVDTQAQARFATGGFDHTVLFGLDYLRANSSRNIGDGAAPSLDVLNPQYGTVPIALPAITSSNLQEQQQVGLYIQDQVRYGGWLGTFGLRYDMSDIDSTERLPGAPTVTNSDDKLTWRAGLTYLFDNGLAPYASYSTSFLPSLGVDNNGDPFKARTAEQYEVGVKYELPGGAGLLTASLFDLTLQNALTWDGSVFNYAQVGEQRVRGLELEGRFELTSRLDVIASYAWSHSKITKSSDPIELGREVLLLPEHQASLWLNYRPAAIEGLSVSAGVRAMSSYQTDFTYDPALRIPGRALVDIGAEYDFGALDKDFAGTTLRVNVTNLFDKKYVSHCLNDSGGSCNYGAGRSITASLKYSW